MTYLGDAGFLQAMIVGKENPLGSRALARLVIMREQYRAARDAGMLYLVQKASEARAIALEQAAVAADRTYLESLIDGSGDLLSEATFPRMKPMFAKYAEGTEMFALLEKAAAVFGEAVQEIATRALADAAIMQARYGRDCGYGD